MFPKLTALILLAISVSALGQGSEKFCGSGWTNSIVPDEFMGCKFSLACKEHDKCYSKCEKEGSHYGTPYCALPESAPERVEAKKQCDVDFQTKINEINKDSIKCRKFAALYKTAVSLVGQGPFNGKEASDLIKRVVATSITENEVKLKVTAIHSLAVSEKIDTENINFDSKESINFTVKDSMLENDLIKNGTLTLKKGVSLDKLQSLSVEH